MKEIPPAGTPVPQRMYNEMAQRVMALDKELAEEQRSKTWFFAGWGCVCFNIGIALGAWIFS